MTVVAIQQMLSFAHILAPKLKAPVNACDCHMHIYDSRFPRAPNATLRPKDLRVVDYRVMQERLGTTRAVVVTPSTYGTDNRCMLAALRELGTIARGVAVVDPTISDDELRELAALGVCGIRFNLTIDAVTTVAMIEPLAQRIRDFGLHVELLMTAQQLLAIEDILRRLPVPVVFDHLGRIPLPEGVRHESFRVIQRLLDERRAWVKLSGAYLRSAIGPPHYTDAGGVAKAFVNIAPDRVVWGSDWPHATSLTQETAMPDDAILFDLLLDWSPDEATRNRILVGNPAQLYNF